MSSDNWQRSLGMESRRETEVVADAAASVRM